MFKVVKIVQGYIQQNKPLTLRYRYFDAVFNLIMGSGISPWNHLGWIETFFPHVMVYDVSPICAYGPHDKHDSSLSLYPMSQSL